MPQLVSDGTMLYRINLAKNRIELARSGGTQWVYRSTFGRKGNLRDLLWFHNRLFALTDTGIWSSSNQGADWGKYGSSGTARKLVALQDGGRYMLGLHEDGRLYRSSNEGVDWVCMG